MQALEFALHSTPDQKVSLSEFRGRPVILAFYPGDWSPVCAEGILAALEELAQKPPAPITQKEHRHADPHDQHEASINPAGH